jgi:hypothetical protein
MIMCVDECIHTVCMHIGACYVCVRAALRLGVCLSVPVISSYSTTFQQIALVCHCLFFALEFF